MSMSDNLPIYQYKDEIVSLIKENNVSIIIGETGSGKSTLLPLFLYESGLTNNGDSKIIAVTQPRRIAAISLAEYVSKLMKTTVGNKVGYSVRFKTVISKYTRIKYLTDGMLIRECITSKESLFNNYCIIIIDEAHERSIRTDFLLGLLKMELNNNNCKIKIVIMSATFQYNDFISFFNKSNVSNLKIGTYNIPGRQFPVKINYLKEPEVDYLEAIMITILSIHFTKPKDGDILVFLPGKDEIQQLYNNLTDINKKIESLYEKDGSLTFFLGNEKFENVDRFKLHIQCLYASMPSEEQSKVFDILPNNYRKVILSTNIAETSVTLPNIVYVIDSGFEKLKYFHANKSIDTLSLNIISKASSIQRAGRAGRLKAGEVYRIYTKESYEDMSNTLIPEILRTSLSETLLELIYILDNYSFNNEKLSSNQIQYNQQDISVKRIMDFPFISYPNKESILSTLKFLYRLEALNIKGNITELGIKLTMLPVIPILGKLIYHSIEFDCTSEAITLVSMISAECFLDYCNNNSNKRLRSKQKDANSYKSYIKSIMVKYGDHIGLIETFNTWVSFNNSDIKNNFNREQISFCNNMNISNNNMIRAKSIRDQLIQITLKVFNLKNISSCIIKDDREFSDNYKDSKWTPLLKCLTKSFWQNSAKLCSNNKEYITEVNRQVVHIHPTSSISHIKEKPRWIIFNDIIQTKKMYIKIISPINHLWLNDYCSKWFITQKP